MNIKPRFTTLVAALSTVAFGLIASPALAGGSGSGSGECASGGCGTPNNNGGGCGCCCGGSILVNYTDLGKTYEQADDSDHDGIDDSLDNCPFTANTDQMDTDGDGVGDACDNCVMIGNHDQAVNECGNLWNKHNFLSAGGISENIGLVKGEACDSECKPAASHKSVTVQLSVASDTTDPTGGNSSNVPKSGEVACSSTAGPAGGVPTWVWASALGIVSFGGVARRRRARKAA